MGDDLTATAPSYVEVALLARHARLGRVLTYEVQAPWQVQPGQAVWVPLGPRTEVGVAVRVGVPEPDFSTRPLLAVLGDRPLVSPLQLELAEWLAARYACSVAEALAGCIPPPARAAPRVRLAPGASAALRAQPGGAALLARFGRRRLLRLVEAAAAATPEAVGEALALGLLEADLPVPERQCGPLPPVALPEPASALTSAQEAVYMAIRRVLDARQPGSFLVHGVTGSGKTHVYLHAARRAVEQGRQVLVLVSDISLVPAAEQRFAAWFPGLVAVVHSQRTPAELARAWARVAAGEARVVVGARSALFAPFVDLGLIVVDEEHESAYKQQDATPCYHARDVALRLGELARAAVVLGSATPDVCTYLRAREGAHRLLVLAERYGGPAVGRARAATGQGLGASLPRVQVVDLRAELAAGNTSMFSRALAAALGRALDQGDQAILFLNRRGTATCVTCRDCGHTIGCHDCSLPMIYHGDLESLLCHHCNHRRRPPERCPACGGRRIRYLGVGTQRVAEEVRRRFPGARLLRWDRDTVAQRGAHERLWAAFAAGEADVLVGTQMVAKGLDFPRVTLVGVVLADASLHLPDYRAAERAFQLLTQVAGRAGRGSQPGQVIVQTYCPQHYAVQAARLHDYDTFAARELAFRREHAYPPYQRLARLLYSDPDEARCWRESGRALRLLRARAAETGQEARLLGPAPAFLRRLRGRYRWQITVVAPEPERLVAGLALPSGWTVDIDPESLL